LHKQAITNDPVDECNGDVSPTIRFKPHNAYGHVGGKGRTTGVGSINPNENAPDAGLSHGALVEQLLSSEAVSSAQLIPRSRSDHPLRLDELVGTLPPSKFVHSCPAQCQRLIVPFEEPVRCMQHAVALGFVLFSQERPAPSAAIL
jgi:hypothetical protein